MSTTVVLVIAGLVGVLGICMLLYGNAQYRRGRATVREEMERESANNLRKRIATDDELARLSPDDLRRRLDGWVRDDGKPL